MVKYVGKGVNFFIFFSKIALVQDGDASNSSYLILKKCIPTAPLLYMSVAFIIL